MPPVDPVTAIKAELHRWHLGRVLIHEFSKLVKRVLPEPVPDDRRGTGDRDGEGDGRTRWKPYRWERVRPVKVPEIGLAAFKHVEQQQQRASMARHFHEAEAATDARTQPAETAGRAARGSGRGRSRRNHVGRYRK